MVDTFYEWLRCGGATIYFKGLVSEFVEYVGGGEGVSGRGKPEEVREST